MHGLGHGKSTLALCLLGLWQSGCDIVQGFRDASAAVFPDEKTYFDAPGFRLVSGGYRDLEFASGSSLYLLARPADRDDDSLHVMLYADPRPCVLAHVKLHGAGGGAFLDATTISYTEEGTQQGTLRFADGNCNTYPVRVPQSGLPFYEISEGFLTYQNRDMIVVNPVTGVTRTIAPESFYVSPFSVFYILYSMGRIAPFKTDWTQVGSWLGDGVVGWGAAGSSYYYEDRAGIHRLVATSGESVSDTVIAPGACKLGIVRNLGANENWAAYFSPCDAKKLVIYADGAAKASPLDIPGDPGLLAFLPAPSNPGGGDPTVDPFFVFYLTDWNDKTNTGKLMMRTPDRQTKEIGQNAAFERLTVFPSAAETHGFALVGLEGNLGHFVRWESDGTTREIASGVVRGAGDPGDLVTDFDGETGQFVLPSAAGVDIVSRRVPAQRFKIRDSKQRWTAIIDDFQDSIATVSITESSLDFTEASRTPAPPPLLTTIARGVLWDYRAQFVPAVPAIAYLTHYDKENDIGRLEYRNLELRFTATISDGVASYLPTPGGLIYSVPVGDGAGIWVVRSR